MFQRLDNVVPDPFFRAVRNEFFLSIGLVVCLSVFSFFLVGALFPLVLFNGRVSDPLADGDSLMGLLDAFWLAFCSIVACSVGLVDGVSFRDEAAFDAGIELETCGFGGTVGL